ncbi:GntR family transcriptional regulator [Bacillus sp. OTU530]|uniref:GntR family transcriptional regulator n=1 Tax=Bacillus sp. OTU530 TaxID=3043862 RepID=UPI00313B0221
MERSVDGTPYYQQLKTKLIEDITNGKLKHGDKIPSERELAEQLKISRMTVRQAISAMEREGFVERKVGAGTFISNRRIRWDFITVNSFTKGMQNKGLNPSTNTIFMGCEPADEPLANALDIAVGEEVFSLKRLRLVDHVPVAIELSQIPYKYCEGIEQYMHDAASLYQILNEYYGITLAKQKQYMRISLSNESESKLLKIKNESPCLLITGTTYDSSDRIIEHSKTLARGDLVEFYSEPTNPK